MGRFARRDRLALWLLLTAGAAAGGIAIFPLRKSPKAPPPSREGYRELYDLGVARLRTGLTWKAIEALDDATRLDPRQPRGHLELAWAYFHAANLEKAIETLDVVLERPELRRYAESLPDFHNFCATRGYFHARIGEHEQALTDYMKAIELQPRLGGLHDYLAVSHLALGSPEEALAAGLRAFELGYRTYDSTLHVGVAYLRLGRHEEAERYIRESIRLHPGHTGAYRNLVPCLLRTGREEEAKRISLAAEKLGRVDDEIVRFRRHLVVIERPDGAYRSRMEAYARYCAKYRKYRELAEGTAQLLAAFPDSGNYHTLRAFAKAELAEEAPAEKLYRRALSLQPDSVEAMNGLALLLSSARDSEIRRPEEALIWAKRAREIGYEGIDFLAVALDANSRTEEARRLIHWDPERGRAWEALRELQLETFQEMLRNEDVEALAVEERR